MSTKPIIFLAFANDRQDDTQYLRNLPKEQKLIREALEPVEEKGLCEIIERPNVTLSEIVDVLQKYEERVAIFHYGGHANSYQLLLENLDGDVQQANAKGLIDLLSRRNGLKLVFLNGCSTETQAIELTRSGIPLVIGTSQSIQDSIATQLATRFYQGLGKGLGIDQAWRDAEGEVQTQIGTKGIRGFYIENEETDRMPWDLHIKKGAERNLSWNIPEAANNPLFSLPSIPEKYYLKLPPKPFIHLKHFEQKDAAIFFGRGKEIRELYHKIKGPYPIILYYGQTGVGKSSVLDAGLLPRLEQSHIIAYKRRDQQLGLSGSLEAVIAELAQKANISTEDQLALTWQALEAHHQLPVIIILDQVEELFTKVSSIGIQQEFTQFIKVLVALFGYDTKSINGKILLAYRKEYNPEIKAAIEAADLAYTDNFLQPLAKLGIIEAIEGITLNQFTQDRYKLSIEKHDSSQLPEIIADDLLEDQQSALAPVLQILLSKLWDAAKENEQMPHFTVLLYQQLKKQGILLSDFFQAQMAYLEQMHPKEVVSGLVIDLLNFHTTSLGTAASQHEGDIHTRYTHQIAILPTLLQSCEDTYLLFKSQKTYTLSHDTLAPIVQQAHKESDLPGQRALRILESKSTNEETTGKQILEEIDLKTVESGRDGMREWTAKEINLIEKSRVARAKRIRQQKQRRQLAIGAASVILLFGLAAIQFFRLATERQKSSKAYYLSGLAERIRPKNPTHALRLAEAAYAVDSIQPHLAVTQTLSNIYHQNHYDKVVYFSSNMQHEDMVGGAIFAPGEDQILSWSRDGYAKLWDLEGTLLTDMKHEGWVLGTVFDQTGKQILTWSGNDIVGHAKLWNLQGTLLADMEHDAWVKGAVFAPEADHILSWSNDGHAKLWNLQGTLLADMKHEAIINGSVFDQEGEQILTWSDDGHIKLWDLQGTLLVDMQHEASVKGAAFDQGEEQILSWSESLQESGGHVKLWDLEGTLLADMKHEGWVNGAVFAQGGEQILTWSDNGSKLWDLEGTLLADMKHEGWYTGAAFNEVSKQVLTWSNDGHAKLWDIEGTLLVDMKHESWILGAVFAQGGEQILTWSLDGHAKLWDLEGTLLAYMQHESALRGMVFAQRGEQILSWSEDGQAKLWDLQRTLPVDMKHEAMVLSADFAQGREYILTWSGNDTVGYAKLWDLQGILLADMQYEDWDDGAIFVQGGEQILSWSGNDTVGHAKLWDLEGTLLADMKHESRAYGAVFSQGREQILSWSGSDTVGYAKLWDIEGTLLADMKHESRVYGAVFSQGREQILSWLGNDTVGHAKLWDLEGTLLADMKHESRVYGAVFAPEVDQILSWSNDGHAKLWNLQGTLLADMIHESRVQRAVFSRGGEQILTISDDDNVKLWDLQGTLLADMIHEDYVWSAIFSKGGDQILTSSYDGHARLWDLQGTLLADMKHESRVEGAVFSEGGDQILTSSYDGHARLWDLQGTLLADMKHERAVLGAVFAPEAGQILSWSDDGHVKLWDLEGTLLADMKHESRVYGAVFAQGGDQILSWSDDGHAKLWDTPKGLFRRLQKKSIGRLTYADSVKYLLFE